MNGNAAAAALNAGSLPAKVPPFSVIIPACNEEAVIARCLAAILAGQPADSEMEIIVAVNGSHDRTAELVRGAAPHAQVIEMERASKALAIERAFRLCRYPVRLVVDADVTSSYHALAATAGILVEPGVMAASPAIRIDTSRSSPLVRAYYKVWQSLPYATQRLVGGGVYGLSEAGYRRLGALPDIIGDDLYVRTRFSFEERRSVAEDASGQPVYTIIHPPRTAIDLIRTEARRKRGKRQVDHDFPTAESGTINGGAALIQSLKRGLPWWDVTIYASVKLLAAALYHWNRLSGQRGWSRDLSSRMAR